MSHLLEVKNLIKTFSNKGQQLVAVDDISFFIDRGECLGLVGESGCGKSTTANMILRLTEADAGEIRLYEGSAGKDILKLRGRELKQYYRDIQMVFQSPQDSFDPRHTLGDGIMESMINAGVSRTEAKVRMEMLLEKVELSPKLAKRYPHEVSGGQCQRAAIARALAVDPKLLVCDEATSALDVTVQAQIVALLNKLKEEMGVSILLICHDLALVQHMCDRVLVMYQGKIVEEGKPDDVIRHPKEDYTKLLIRSV
ncbi:MAG: ABC transporter ATP-binding protein [Lachnospiraceae bacterium]|nr:ABC transporter ATP-binding protein [Lachnospiraceae bacterium]